MIGMQYLNLVLSKKDFSLIRNVKDIDALFLQPLEQQVLSFIRDHWQKYGQVPDPETVLRHHPDFDLLTVNESPEALLHDMREQRLATEVAPVIRRAAELYKDDAIASVEYMQNEVLRLAKLISRDVHIYDYTKAGAIRLEDYKLRASLTGMVGIPTGFPGLDNDTQGWWNGHLNLIGGRLNEGKTWLGLKSAAVAWLEGKRVGVWSLESSHDEMSFRLDTIIKGIPNMALFSGKLSEADFAKWQEHLKFLEQQQPLYILTNKDNGGSRWTAGQIAKIVEEQELDFVVIDQASLMDDGRNSRTIRERFINVATDSKTLAEETNIPWMLLVQVNREAAKDKKSDNTPGMENISEADALGQFADRAVLIKQIPPMLKATLRKNRFGPRDKDYILKWDVNIGVIEEVGSIGLGVDAF
jgi:replicative DNA helicase